MTLIRTLDRGAPVLIPVAPQSSGSAHTEPTAPLSLFSTSAHRIGPQRRSRPSLMETCLHIHITSILNKGSNEDQEEPKHPGSHQRKESTNFLSLGYFELVCQTRFSFLSFLLGFETGPSLS